MIRTNSAHDPKRSSKTTRLVFWNTKIFGIQSANALIFTNLKFHYPQVLTTCTQDPGNKQNLSSETENSTWSCLGQFCQAPLVFSGALSKSPSLLFSAFVHPSEGHSGRWHFGTEKHLGCTYKYLFVGQHVIEFSSIMAGVFVAKYWKLVSETPLRRGRATSWFGSIGMFWRCWTVLRLNSIMAAKEFSFFLLIGLDGHVEVSFVF